MNSGAADHRARLRNETIRGAVATSILSKLGTLLLRLISIPVAKNVLGMEQFGVYATILVAVQLVDMFHVGIGPVLTQRLSKACLANDRENEARLFSTGILISASLTILIAMILAIVVGTVPIVDLFGDKYAPFAESMRRACWIGIALISVEMICVVVEKARDGYMETRYTNAWGAGGNFLGAGALMAGIVFFPTIEFLVLAINGSVVLAKVANTIHLFLQRPYLIPKPSKFQVSLVRSLAKGALIFTIVYSLSALVEYNILSYLVGRFLGPGQAANYFILVTIHMSLTGIIQMFTIPFWPALIDAFERGDHDWVRRGSRRIRGTAVLFGGSVLVGAALLGPLAIDLWVGDDFTLSRAAVAVFGGYFALHLWRHVNQILCLGLSRERPVAAVIFGESFCVLLSASLLLGGGHEILPVLGAICVCLASFSAWLFPLIFRDAFRSAAEGRNLAGSGGENIPGGRVAGRDGAESRSCEVV